MPLVPNVNFITLGVKDMKMMRQFYERLGCVASSSSNEHVTFFNTKTVVLALFGVADLAEDAGLPAAETSSYRGVALAWNGETQAHVDQIMAHAASVGGRITKPAQKVFWGGYSGYFADPEGHLWEVAYNPYATCDAHGRILMP